MKKIQLLGILRSILILAALFCSGFLFGQKQNIGYKSQNYFRKKVQFGGGIGLIFGSDYTDITLTPSAIYNLNKYVALGLGAQYTYMKQRNYYASHLYGGSIIALLNPIAEIQLSAELEELRVNVDLIDSNGYSHEYWNTGLFLGAGYKSGNVTIGARYNVLNNNSDVYGSAFMPFV